MGEQTETTAARRLAVVVPLALAFTVFSLEVMPPADQPTEMWGTMAATVIWSTVVWDGRTRPGLTQAAHVLGQLSLFLMVALAFDWPLADALWMGVTNIGVGVGLVVVYARLRRGHGWSPATASANLTLLGLAAVAGVLVALLGGYPNLEAGQIDRLTLWWILRNTVYVYVGSVCFLGLFFSGQRWVGEGVPRWVVGALAPLGAVCLWVTYYDPELPLTWFLLLPAVVAGSVLTVRGAALYALCVALGGALATLHPINQWGYTGIIPGSVIIDLLLTASTFITLHLAVLRDQRAAATDLLEQERAAADEQAELLRTVFESMSDGLVVLDDQQRVVLHNVAARQLVGRRIPVGVPVDWVTHFGLRSGDGTDLSLQDLTADADGSWSGQLMVDSDGHPRVLDVRSWPMHGTPDRTIVLFSDVTAERDRLSELTGFAGVVAHDLRSPLASLHGWLELAADAVSGPRPAGAMLFLERAQLNSHRMLQVIEDWLAYTVNRDGLLNRSQVCLDGLLSEIVAPYSSQDADSSPLFELDARHTVDADRMLTRQLLANLIGNAVKYTRDGERPHVRVCSRPDEEAGFVRVDVSDRGIGLPPGQEERIFEEFHRAPEHAQTFAGTGLGLSLCRRIVSRHGGQIMARNNPEGGATFSFTLPAA
ncbi:sensor histidine kinase [Nocardioides coralli]|uniref:sensor histidine kinase n=1 Tax=Nocardioides coralli TaxID=2872154 RepID=UPI001CA451A6|nr:ATP-binding protein [Nocardioides coralli]QZY28269.1 PAS domain-containing protein [Nocardioides coralli]